MFSYRFSENKTCAPLEYSYHLQTIRSGQGNGTSSASSEKRLKKFKIRYDRVL